jgi:glutamine synthetase
MSTNTKADILRIADEKNIRFIRLQFTDVLGALKSVEITRSQLESALDNDCMFDGSNVEGFVKIEDSDMYLHPDCDSFSVFPWYSPLGEGKVARLISDVYKPNGVEFEGDPRNILKKALKKAAYYGFVFNVGVECEFYLFPIDAENRPSTDTSDEGGYFDIGPVDKGEDCRREICAVLEDMGLLVETSHHQNSPSQHEIDIKYDEALRTADNVLTFKYVVKSIAQQHGFNATFMPKPVYGLNGSGMHINMSLFKGLKNTFHDESDPNALSQTAYKFIAGIMEHAKAMTLVFNPLVNSYRRLVPGFDAPVHLAWSAKNRSSLIRIPASRGMNTRIELRSPDAASNPYLAIATCLMAGLDGIEKNLTPPPATNTNVFNIGRRQSDQVKIEMLPASIEEAIECYQKDAFMRETLGEHTFNQYLYSKKRELNAYRSSVSQWELDNYYFKY